jgi:hypothetical protein
MGCLLASLTSCSDSPLDIHVVAAAAAGTVRDSRGVAVAGAWVVVEAQTTGEAETHPIATDSALTDQAGTYLVELTAALAPPMDATADLRVVAPSGSGLAGATASGLALRFTFDLQAEDSLHQDFVLADE